MSTFWLDSCVNGCATTTISNGMLVSTAIMGIILFGISIWQIENMQDNNLTGFSWDNFCETSPQTYLSPFAFILTGNGISDSSLYQCGWPEANTAFRSVVTWLLIITSAVMLWKQDMRMGGSLILYLSSALFFSVAVLDSNALRVGNGICEDDFQDLNINFGTLDVECKPGNFLIPIFFDFILCILAYFTAAAIRRIGTSFTASYSGQQDDRHSNLINES